VAVDRFRKATTILPPLNPCPHGNLERPKESKKSSSAGHQPAPSEIKPDPEIKQEPFTIRGCFGIHDSYTDR
jgi:hypothetical protein